MQDGENGRCQGHGRGRGGDEEWVLELNAARYGMASMRKRWSPLQIQINSIPRSLPLPRCLCDLMVTAKGWPDERHSGGT